MERANSERKKGYYIMSDKAKFWFTLIVPLTVSIVLSTVAWVASYGALSQEVKEVRDDVRELKDSFQSVTDNVRRLGEIVSANTRELRVRFEGGQSAQLLYNKGASTSCDLLATWGDFPTLSEPTHNQYAEQVESLGWGADVCEFYEAEPYGEWATNASMQTLLSDEPAYLWERAGLSM